MSQHDLLSKALFTTFTDAGFCAELRRKVLAPTEDWGPATKEPVATGYTIPQDPVFVPEDTWASWNVCMDRFLVKELGLKEPGSGAKVEYEAFVRSVTQLRDNLADLAEKPLEYRLRVISSWSELTTLTDSFAVGGGVPLC